MITIAARRQVGASCRGAPVCFCHSNLAERKLAGEVATWIRLWLLACGPFRAHFSDPGSNCLGNSFGVAARNCSPCLQSCHWSCRNGLIASYLFLESYHHHWAFNVFQSCYREPVRRSAFLWCCCGLRYDSSFFGVMSKPMFEYRRFLFPYLGRPCSASWCSHRGTESASAQNGPTVATTPLKQPLPLMLSNYLLNVDQCFLRISPFCGLQHSCDLIE